MKIYKLLGSAIALTLSMSFTLSVQASPTDDKKAFRNFFTERFPTVKISEYVNGVYSIDASGRENWEAIEEFPPYEPFIDAGREMWNAPFANGKGYSSCFPDGPAIGTKYPAWDMGKEMVMTLPLALNNCRKANGEKPLKYKKGSINDILAFISWESRGQVTNVVIPDDPKALAAYEAGKKFYYDRRGQLNFSCATCHLQNSGKQLRADILSPALGHTTHQPVYRSKWGTIGTLHRRFSGCNKQVRAKPFKAQGAEYRNLEYFLTYMSNGLELNGPGARK